MADIMIDLTSRPRKRYTVHRCFYCDNSKFPHGRVIDPTTDIYAKIMEDGSHKCGVCVGEDVKKSLSLFGGSSK
jgi:hypothetical protein